MKFFRKFLVLALATLIAVGAMKEFGGWERLEQLGKKTAGPTVTPQESFKFAVMGDIHLDWENFQKALSKAKADKADFVIVVGDLTSLGKKNELSEAKKVLDESDLKYYVIPGNHDLWSGKPTQEAYFRELFGPDFQSFKKDGVKFILVNNGGVTGIEEIVGNGGIKQGDWLREEIKECPKVTCLVFMHMPLNHPNSLHVMGEDNPEVTQEAKNWVKLLSENRVREVFAGHLHYSSSYELEGLRTTIVGALTGDRNLQSAKFLEVKSSGTKLEKEEVFLPN